MTYKILFDKNALEDLEYWKKTNNQNIIKKIKSLLIDIQEHPFVGIGKPEALKNNLTGYWSRRINKEHRLIYTIKIILLLLFNVDIIINIINLFYIFH